jgi:hypothetical protein
MVIGCIRLTESDVASPLSFVARAPLSPFTLDGMKKG